MASDIKQSENRLYQDAVSIIDNGRKRVIESVYNETTNSYYALGKLIVEVEQNGELKATYGKKVVENLSKKLTLKYGKGFSTSTLWDCQKFYKKLQSLSGVLDCQKSQSVTGELRFRLSFTHYTYLMRLDDKEMKFYESYAIEQKLSVRELQKAVQNNTILRLEEKKQDSKISQIKPKEIVKDPYILDFLGLEEIKTGEEKVLENKLIEHLENFLLELGRGFAFVGRQYRLTLSEDSYFADLVFYNIPLKCYVIIELKARKLKHQDLGQLQMYVNYFDREIKDDNDNKTVGILLCNDKNEKVVEYTFPQENNQIFASKYKLYLPTKEELVEELSGESD